MPTPISFSNHYANLPQAFFEKATPATAPKPSLIKLNLALSQELGIDSTWLDSTEGIAMLSGNTLPPSASPIAMVYAGHQFGGFSPRLGDGRAILLGELTDRNGILRDLQLKGSGRTAYSRGGDGKATLGAIVREYILSEAMFALGVPTTRALAIVRTGESIQREQRFPGAILARVAQSHVRVGTFEYFSSQRDFQSLKTLADYVIDRHYPNARKESNAYQGLLANIVGTQASLIARWMQLGFIHGVMNTDNMQIAGQTIDYGPCAFMDNFHPQCVFSSIDRNGRYAWDKQPVMAHWNLTRLAQALMPLFSDNRQEAQTIAENTLLDFEVVFQRSYLKGFSRKLGLPSLDKGFLAKTLSLLAKEEVDFTLFFHHLTQAASGLSKNHLVGLFKTQEAGAQFLQDWTQRFDKEKECPKTRAAIMVGTNPVLIPRNHRVEEAIQAANQDNFEPFHKLCKALSRPYETCEEFAEYRLAPLEEQRVRETFCGT